MNKLLVSLIHNYEIGAFITGDIDIIWSGDVTMLHIVEGGDHVWMKRDGGKEWLGYGSSPRWEREQ